MPFPELLSLLALHSFHAGNDRPQRQARRSQTPGTALLARVSRHMPSQAQHEFLAAQHHLFLHGFPRTLRQTFAHRRLNMLPATPPSLLRPNHNRVNC